MSRYDFLAAKTGALIASAASGGFAAMFDAGGVFSAERVIIASAGSGVSLVIMAMAHTPEPDVSTSFRRALTQFVAFIVGALFGLFMGGSFSRLPFLDEIGGLFIAGIVGWGFTLMLTKPETIASLFNYIIDKMKGDSNGSA